jgi:hypothetical protein
MLVIERGKNRNKMKNKKEMLFVVLTLLTLMLVMPMAFADVCSGQSCGADVNLTISNIAPTIPYVTPVSAVTLNGGTTKDIYIIFDTSSELVNETFAQVIVTNGEESRTSSSCSSISSTEFNCTISMEFYDSAGTWTINATIQNDTETFENTTEIFSVNALDYVTQNINYIEWTSLIPNTNDNQADNTIIFTNEGNQDYATMNIKAYDVLGDVYANLISASQFSVDNVASATSGQIYLQNDTDIDVSSKLNLNTHSSSSIAEAYFYIDVPSEIRGDIYHQLNSWSISLL